MSAPQILLILCSSLFASLLLGALKELQGREGVKGINLIWNMRVYMYLSSNQSATTCLHTCAKSLRLALLRSTFPSIRKNNNNGNSSHSHSSIHSNHLGNSNMVSGLGFHF